MELRPLPGRYSYFVPLGLAILGRSGGNWFAFDFLPVLEVPWLSTSFCTGDSASSLRLLSSPRTLLFRVILEPYLV
jgi:hypothetical protein